MAARTRGSRTTWILAGLWLAAIVFAIAVAAQDTSGGGSLFSKILAGLGALATLTSLARDILPGEGPRKGTPDQPGDRSAAQDADLLADAVQQSWSEEAQVRRLHGQPRQRAGGGVPVADDWDARARRRARSGRR